MITFLHPWTSTVRDPFHRACGEANIAWSHYARAMSRAYEHEQAGRHAQAEHARNDALLFRSTLDQITFIATGTSRPYVRRNRA